MVLRLSRPLRFLSMFGDRRRQSFTYRHRKGDSAGMGREESSVTLSCLIHLQWGEGGLPNQSFLIVHSSLASICHHQEEMQPICQLSVPRSLHSDVHTVIEGRRLGLRLEHALPIKISIIAQSYRAKHSSGALLPKVLPELGCLFRPLAWRRIPLCEIATHERPAPFIATPAGGFRLSACSLTDPLCSPLAWRRIPLCEIATHERLGVFRSISCG